MSDQTQNILPHRRYNPLNGDWVLVSPHRATRPWQGQVEEVAIEGLPAHDPECYLCAGNTRAGGAVNPDYIGPYVFDNDFPSLLEKQLEEPLGEPGSQVNQEPGQETELDALFRSEAVSGISRVICFSEQHHLTLPEMTIPSIRMIIETWTELYLELADKYQWVQIFENKGAINGCSNPHPHGQLWASDCVPTLVGREDEKQKRYMAEQNRSLLVDYCLRELVLAERVVCSNPHWVVLVPYWATWPFETLLLPSRQVSRFTDLESEEKDSLAEILQTLTTKYDNLFQTSFPYSMGWHGAPNPGGGGDQHWQLHAHFYPPLLRSATIRKFMVGYEMLAEAQRDMTPEQAAAQLREQSEKHFKTGRQ